MCGIAGILSQEKGGGQPLRACLTAMTDTVRHRGPDNQGEWIDEVAGVALGHRRLSIQDLSVAGHQPMVSQNGRWIIIYNGEIYNFQDIRQALDQDEKIAWRGHCDSEVLLEAIARWGISKALESIIGMYAFAIWDREEQRLHLVRDRLGVKPLYYTQKGGKFAFGSEIRAVLSCGFADRGIAPSALGCFLELGYCAGSQSIFEDIRKLRPAHILTVDADGTASERRYWSLPTPADLAFVPKTEDALAEELEALLRDVCNSRMIADVPVGVFLSGGIDSTLITTLLAQGRARDLVTLTIGFNEPEQNEADLARATARFLGSTHYEKYFSMDRAKDVLATLPQVYDEPLADPSTLPTILVSGFAAEHVKVVLSGDGGDELFAGYKRYRWAETAERWVGSIPAPLRAATGPIIRGAGCSRLGAALGLKRGKGKFARMIGDRAAKMADLMGEHTRLGRSLQFNRLVSKTALVKLLKQPGPLFRPETAADLGTIDEFARFDLQYYMPDDLMVKVDRATMFHSIEGREPLLDHRLIEFASRLPLEYKLRGGTTKYLLRRILKKHLPEDLIDRPKRGFSVPIIKWMCGDLAPTIDSYLDHDRVRATNLFHEDQIRLMRASFDNGSSEHAMGLFALLVFMMWHERWA